MEGIIRIARTLNLKVIAEGIETEVQRDLLVSMGCQFGQGYLLAMPVEADQAEALVRIGRGLVPELPRVSRYTTSSTDGRGALRAARFFSGRLTREQHLAGLMASAMAWYPASSGCR